MIKSELITCPTFSCRLLPAACAARWAKNVLICADCPEGRRRAAALGLAQEEPKTKGRKPNGL